MDITDVVMGASASGKAGARVQLQRQKREVHLHVDSELLLDFLCY